MNFQDEDHGEDREAEGGGDVSELLRNKARLASKNVEEGVESLENHTVLEE